MRRFVKKFLGPLILAVGGLFGANTALAQETDVKTDTITDREQSVFNVSVEQSDLINQALDLSRSGGFLTGLDDEFNAQSFGLPLGQEHSENCARQSLVKICDDVLGEDNLDAAYESMFDDSPRDRTRRVYLRMGSTSVEREKTDFSKSTALYFYKQGDVDVSVGRYTQRAPRVLGTPSIKQRFEGLRVQKRF